MLSLVGEESVCCLFMSQSTFQPSPVVNNRKDKIANRSSLNGLIAVLGSADIKVELNAGDVSGMAIGKGTPGQTYDQRAYISQPA